MSETSHVVFPVVPHGDVFVDLLEYPQTLSIAESFMGPDMVMSDNALHVKPAGTTSHVGWHRDSSSWKYEEGWSEEDQQAWESMHVCETPFLKIKIFYFVQDVDETTSPFSVVPGSHRWDTSEIPEYEDVSDMQGYVKMVGKAGDALLWNGCILHAAMDNTDNKARRMLFYNYIHFGMKQHEPCVPKGEFKESLKDRSPLCQQLFGLERMGRE
jgi:ectoine hydroxylase-related dioxygenase (phytanoyl-CoA dioxygenase family)